MKKQEYYKVVLVKNNKLFSVNKDCALKVQYYLHRPVVAPIGGLFVFTDLREAKRFAGNDPDCRIYRCTTRNPVALSYPYYISWEWTSKAALLSYWVNRVDWSTYKYKIYPCLDYTATFKTVTLRERVA